MILDAAQQLLRLARNLAAGSLTSHVVARSRNVRHAALLRSLRLQQQEHEAQHARKQRGRQNGQLRRGDVHLVGISKIRHEDGHGEADASQDAGSQHMEPVHVLGQRGQLALDDRKAHQHDAERLAHQQAQHDTVQHRIRKHGADVHTREADIGIGQSEQGQDAEVHPRIQLVLETSRRRHNLARHLAEIRYGLDVVALRDDGRLGLERVARLTNLVARPRDEALEINARPRRDNERQQHARDGGMNARHEHAVPQHGTHQQIRHQRVDVAAVHQHQHHQHGGGHAQPEHRRAVAVEDGDHQDGDDIVGHG